LEFVRRKMIIQRSSLDSLLLNNVCEVRFTRRRPVAGKSSTRRMWCTKSYSLLNSMNGRVSLNYRAPSHPKQINESLNNVLVVWDILMQDYRIISFERCELLQQVPANDSFWEFFNEKIYTMTTEQKINFMNQ
jgi:hypothetical protein